MRIAITGGTSFAGRDLTERLRTDRHEPVMIRWCPR